MSSAARPRITLAMDPALTPDLFDDESRKQLGTLGDLTRPEPLREYTSESARRVLGDTTVLLTGWGAPLLDAAALDSAPQLRLLVHTGSSVKAVASDEVWARGVTVSSAAAANAVPVAEYALAMILLANKGAFAASRRYTTERAWWHPAWIAPGEPGNFTAVVGVVGASRTGRRLLELLRAFDLKVLVYDPFISTDDAAAFGAEKVELDELLRRSQTVTIHAPLVPQTRGMIGAHELALLRDGSVLVNTARGELIDASALEAELVHGRLSAILDVTDPEPLDSGSTLFDLPNVMLTPHIAGASGFETRRMAALAISEIERFAHGEPCLHAVAFDSLGSIG